MFTSLVFERRVDAVADLPGIRAARVKMTAWRRINRGGDFALEGLCDPGEIGVGDGNGVEKGFGIGMARLPVEFRRFGQFDDSAEIHDRHPIADVLDD